MTMLPPNQAADLVLPLNKIGDRALCVSQAYHAPNHRGIDYCWVWREGDPTDRVRRSHGGRGGYVTLPGALQLAVCDGVVLYSEWRDRGWATRVRGRYGWDYCFMHGVRGTARVVPHQHVAAGAVIAEVGADPTDPEGFAHLHFEIRIPVNDGVAGRDGWGCQDTDPWPYLRSARLIEVPHPSL
jgi:hypothetical protein